MSIEAEIVVTLADVEVADDYRLRLTLLKPSVLLDHTQAEQLATELLTRLVEARDMLAADFPVTGLPPIHGFDKDLALASPQLTLCGLVNAETGLPCTRPPGHPGRRHVAGSDDAIYAVWDDDEVAP